MAKLQRDYPAARFRVIRPYKAVCIACGQEYKWTSEVRVFQPLQATKLDGRFPVSICVPIPWQRLSCALKTNWVFFT